MAVTLDVLDLVLPDGELDDSFFPDNDLNTHLSGWLTQAILRVEGNADINVVNHDLAAAAWVYYQAYNYIANRLGSMPNSVSMNRGADSVSIAQDRPAFWQRKAELKLNEFNLYIQPRVVNRTPRDSMSIPTRTVW